MDVKYIKPFVDAVQKLFNTMIEVPFKLGKPTLTGIHFSWLAIRTVELFDVPPICGNLSDRIDTSEQIAPVGIH